MFDWKILSRTTLIKVSKIDTAHFTGKSGPIHFVLVVWRPKRHVSDPTRLWRHTFRYNVWCGSLFKHQGPRALMYSLQLDCSSRTNTWTVNLTENRKGYDKSKTMNKSLSEMRFQICRDYFCVTHLTSFQNNFPNNVRIKIVPAEWDSPRRTLLCRGLRYLRCLGSLAN